MSNKLVTDMPESSGQPTTPEEARAIIAKRMAALESGESKPEDFVKKHKEAMDDGSSKSTYPTMIVNLPSLGSLYPADNPLSLGYVEMKPMTAKEEDILTTESYIKQNVVLDKLFQSLIVTKIDYDSMLIGDRDAIMLAARIYGYGEEYRSKITTPSGNTQEVLIDLNEIPHKELHPDVVGRGENLFEFKTASGNMLKFRLLTNGDQREIQANLKKAKRGDARDRQLTTRLAQMVHSVDGNEDLKFVKLFVENMRALDSRKWRDYVAELQPGVDMMIDVVDEETGEPFRTSIAIGLDFFWIDL